MMKYPGLSEKELGFCLIRIQRFEFVSGEYNHDRVGTGLRACYGAGGGAVSQSQTVKVGGCSPPHLM